MKRVLLIAAVVLGLVGVAELGYGQGPNTPPRGTNYDPPPVPQHKEQPPPPPPPEEPIFSLSDIDMNKSQTWVKMALLLGSVGLALRAFRQMKGN
ncbi:hypothetical protein [uncultured Paludibaculum sp.]|uniref:hypothetical protein n=1 Tax=uncultured Paludibaculum sp. TaxID=1765020 RepID=UPI002AAAE2E4|nr:hypothetical protein [uncultured Paludibaculum sp.]